MNPEDIKRMSWAEIQGALVNMRQTIFLGFFDHGPCTNKHLAATLNIGLDSVRPRTTELVDLGLVECVGTSGRQGIYQAVPAAIARDRHEHKMATQQLQLKLA